MLQQFEKPEKVVEKGVAVLVGVSEVRPAQAEFSISTAVRDVQEVAESLQAFDFDTYSLHDDRVWKMQHLWSRWL